MAAGFLLSGPGGTVSATGRTRSFDDARAAAAALRSGAAAMVVGALPFDPAAPAALTVPESVTRSAGAWVPHPDAPQLSADALRVHVTGYVPSAEEHLARIGRLLHRVDDGELDKVVAARAVLLEADAPISRTALLARLVAGDTAGNGFTVDLSPAGGRYAGRALVGASPETLVRRRGRRVECRPLAGTAARTPGAAQSGGPEQPGGAGDPAARALLNSGKNLREHAFVVDWIRGALAPLCSGLDVPPTPTLLSTPHLWHLGTEISGTLADPSTSALDLALALHPTPAVCGTPTDRALHAIRETEEPRGFYAGAVGWCDDDGDGEWVVAIRCAELSPDRRSALAHAGGGIVAGSRADAELAETDAKLRTLRRALGA
ncbi:isochorismate synthase MenF [Tomitella fengzijianii]